MPQALALGEATGRPHGQLVADDEDLAPDLEDRALAPFVPRCEEPQAGDLAGRRLDLRRTVVVGSIGQGLVDPTTSPSTTTWAELTRCRMVRTPPPQNPTTRTSPTGRP